MQEPLAQSDDIQWPTQLPQLKMLDHHLRCPICYNYFDKPVLATGCSHSFCSLCIRKYITIKNSCPVCSLEVTDRMLKSNRILDEIILAYHPIRKFILTGDKISKNSSTILPESTIEHGTSSNIARIDTPPKEPCPELISRQGPVQDSEDRIVAEQPSTSQRNSSVQCPICLVNMDETKINAHLDACLKSEKSSKHDEKPPPRKPMPKLIYAIMQEKEIRKRLKTLGLSHQGDKKTLINRHKKYTNLYNAECDSANPRPVEELIRELEREEAAEKKLAAGRKQYQQQQQQQQPERGKLSEEDIDKMNRDYIEKNRDHFRRLIDEIKQRDNTNIPAEESKASEDDEIMVLPQAPKVFEEISLIDEDDAVEQSSIPHCRSQLEASTPDCSLLGSLGYVNTPGQDSPSYSPVGSPSGSSSADQFPEFFGHVAHLQSEVNDESRSSRNRRAPPESPSDETNHPRRSTRRKF